MPSTPALGIDIPTERLVEDDFISNLNFSNRGSLMFGKEGDLVDGGVVEKHVSDDRGSATPTQSSLARTESNLTVVHNEKSNTSEDGRLTPVVSPRSFSSPTPDIRVLTPDTEMESQKVRSLYETGDGWDANSARHSYCERLEPTPEVEDDTQKSNAHLNPDVPSDTQRSGSSLSQYQDTIKRETELAGGLEDWEDVDGASVDRYGFITMPRHGSRLHTPTEMKSAQFSPRRRNVLQKRDPMGFQSGPIARRMPSRKVSARSLNTQNSEMSTVSFRSSRSVIRQAGNLLPYNRNRRWMDEAGDMLTVSPNLQDAVEEARVEKISEALKRKEWERSEKWRKMAKVIRKGDQGHGMEFEFDTKNPKLVERTWKGIPDRWRGAAWWSFLDASAKERANCPSTDSITTDFRRLQDRASPDDVQIDLDVPRTISRHIMFRKRYRGGQRLLFRVLHALSLYFPETGYVQGMASLAATLLCYFDEEKCFVMLVRMWQLRGLERLYEPGFDGLMLALREFESKWLNAEVANRLTTLGVDPTAYGTRWYLTLFNLSIPFPAQLRVWDVFLLLGDSASGTLLPTASTATTKPGSAATNTSNTATNTANNTAKSGLDVLHATSAAVIEALREVLLDSDFENAMKALTSWIPIKDEDLLMKVTRAEWRTQQGKKRG